MFSYIQKITQHTPLSIFPSGIFPSSVRLHSLSQKKISEHQIPSEFSQVKSVLSQLEKANVVEIIGMTKSSSGSELKKFQTAVVLGKKSAGVSPSLESHLAVVEVSPIVAGEAFALRYEGKIELPKLMNRWNVEKMIEESLKGGFQGELFFGKSSQMESVKVVAELEKTEELKREIRESPEFKKCMLEQRYQELLTPMCTIVRQQAASMNKIRLTINTPKAWSKSNLMTHLDSVFKVLLLGNVESEKTYSGTEGVTIVEATTDRVSQAITSKVFTPT